MNRTISGRIPGEPNPRVGGRISIPASKSHTIRALLIAAFARGESRLGRPLVSRDSLSARSTVQALGATVHEDGEDWLVQGIGSLPKASGITIDVGNSGTTLYLASALAALANGPVSFDGDAQIRRRSAAPLLDALSALGATVESSSGGCAPFTVTGPLKPGPLTVDCPVSQYLSALLLAAPLIPSPNSNTDSPDIEPRRPAASAGHGGSAARGIQSPIGDTQSPDNGLVSPPAREIQSLIERKIADSGTRSPADETASSLSAPEVNNLTPVTTINVRTLNEAPYVGITLDWLDSQGIRYERDGWTQFTVPAGQSYISFDRVVPADWSSATFFLVAAAITEGTLTLNGVDSNDSQGDKAVADMLETMGCRLERFEGGITIEGRPLNGAVLDLNATPDALPAMAVAACYAEGETRLVNVPQARLKETDRIAVMASQLRSLGAEIDELPDGLVIHGHRPSPRTCDKPSLRGALVDGHDDHRVVMALAVAGLGCCGRMEIRGAEAADVTFPGFFKLLETAVAGGKR
jgi:5-enolpyruvylshikimate-3-phosphate synthase